MKFLSRTKLTFLFAKWLVVPLLLGLLGYLYIGPAIGNSPQPVVEEATPKTPSIVQDKSIGPIPLAEMSKNREEQQSKATLEPEVEISVDFSDKASTETSYSNRSSFEETFPKEKPKKVKGKKKSLTVIIPDKQEKETDFKKDAEPPAIALPETDSTSEV